MEVIDGNDGVLAAGIAVTATMQLFVCTPETSHVGTNRAHIVLAVICLYSRDLARWYQQGPHSSKSLSSRKCTPNDIPRRVGPREEIQ